MLHGVTFCPLSSFRCACAFYTFIEFLKLTNSGFIELSRDGFEMYLKKQFWKEKTYFQEDLAPAVWILVETRLWNILRRDYLSCPGSLNIRPSMWVDR